MRLENYGNKKNEMLSVKKRNVVTEIICYVFLAVLTVIILGYVLKLWDKDLTIPFSYNIDALGPLKEIKNMILGNSLYEMPQLGAPLGGTEQLTIKGFLWHFLMLKILTLFTNEVGLVINMYYLIGFPITSLIMFWVLRKLKINRIFSMVFSIVFCFLPYHFYKGTFHIFYASYYLIPLAVLLLICILIGEKSRNIFSSKRVLYIYGIVISILVGISDTYYGAFLCIFLAFSGIYATVSYKEKKYFIHSAICIISTGLAVVVAVAPTFLYTMTHNAENVFSSSRSIYDIELYSLKLAHLILPMHGHRIDGLNNLRIAYDQNTILAPESSYIALGIIMALGFLFSIACVFIKVKFFDEKLVTILGKLNLFTILVSTIGGLDVFIGMFLTTSIRSYARIVVFIACFSAVSGALLLNSIIKNLKIKKIGIVNFCIAVILLFIAIFDQTSPNFEKLGYYEVFSNSINLPYNEIIELYNSDKEFVKKVEEGLNENDMIFQLPIVADSIYNTFPNGNSGAYGLIRPYLHSSGKVRWSQGAQKGDKNDNWLKQLSQYSYQDIIYASSIVGFSGVYIDKTGLSQDDFNYLDDYLKQITDSQPIISKKKDLYYYDLSKYNDYVGRSISNRDEYKDVLLQLGRLNGYYSYDAEELYYSGDMEVASEGVHMKKNTIQFGPYINLNSGVYEIKISGENLKNVSVSAYTNKDSINCRLDINGLSQEDNQIIYRIQSDNAMEELECSITANEDVSIEKYEISKVEEGNISLNELKEKVDEIFSERELELLKN